MQYKLRDCVFEWDAAKAEANEQKHDVEFEAARLVFFDDFRVDFRDFEHSASEDRWQTIGRSFDRILFVVYVERKGDVIRIISARKATKHEQKIYRQNKAKRR